MSSPFGTAVLVSGPEQLLAQRFVMQVKQRAVAAHPEAEVNEINAAELEDAMLSEVLGGSLFSAHIIAVVDDVGACPRPSSISSWRLPRRHRRSCASSCCTPVA